MVVRAAAVAGPLWQSGMPALPLCSRHVRTLLCCESSRLGRCWGVALMGACTEVGSAWVHGLPWAGYARCFR